MGVGSLRCRSTAPSLSAYTSSCDLQFADVEQGVLQGKTRVAQMGPKHYSASWEILRCMIILSGPFDVDIMNCPEWTLYAQDTP